MEYLIENKHKDFAENIVVALRKGDRTAYQQASAVFNSAVNAFNAYVQYEYFKIKQFSDLVNVEVQKLGWNEQQQQAPQPEAKTEAKPETKQPAKAKAKK